VNLPDELILLFHYIMTTNETLTIAEIESAVIGIISAAEVTVTPVLLGETKREEWLCDEWRVTFNKGNTTEVFQYFTGIGHRKSKVPVPPEVKRSPRTLYAEEWKRQHLKPVKPHPAGVLHSLILDSSASSESFNSWCDNFGYDTDSRKALATYELCQVNSDKLARIFTSAQRQALSDVLQDY